MEFRDPEKKIKDIDAETEEIMREEAGQQADQQLGAEINGSPEELFQEEAALEEEEAVPGEIEILPVLDEMKKKKKGRGTKVISLVLVALLSAGAGFGGGVGAMYWLSNTMPGSFSGQSQITINPADHIDTAEAIAEKVIPSVVGISTTVTYQNWWGEQQSVPEGVGTGIIIDEKGYILTNSHVVGDGTTRDIIVQLTDGREVKGTVLWNDKNIDLAIVKVEVNGLTAAELGNSEEVKIGSYAVAIGNPLGLAFDRSVTQGVISGMNRTITVGDARSSIRMEGLLQTDASINSGNSGGPLLNSKGEVIGINSAKAQSGEGLGFAIPINVAKPIVEQIKSKGEFSRAYIGITGVSVADFLNQYPDAGLKTKTGVFVTQIYTRSPAAEAGILEKDIIVAVDDKKIETMNQLIGTLYQYRPGDTVNLEVVRGLKTITINVTLQEMTE